MNKEDDTQTQEHRKTVYLREPRQNLPPSAPVTCCHTPGATLDSGRLDLASNIADSLEDIVMSPCHISGHTIARQQLRCGRVREKASGYAAVGRVNAHPLIRADTRSHSRAHVRTHT